MLHSTLNTLSHAFDVIAQAGPTTTTPGGAGGLPNPGRGVQPPGTGGLTTIANWVAWIAFFICLIGVIIAGAGMAIQHRRGEGGESVARLGWVLGGCVTIGAASALVGGIIV